MTSTPTSHGNDLPLDYITPPPTVALVTPVSVTSSPTQSIPYSGMTGSSFSSAPPSSSSNASPTQSCGSGGGGSGSNGPSITGTVTTLVAPPPPATVRRRSKMACDTCHYRKIKCDVDKGHPCKNCEKNNVQCTLVGPAMRPPRSTSGSSSAAAAAAVAMAVAAAAAARQGQEANSSGGGLHHSRAEHHKGSFAPGHTSLTRRASASGSIVRSSGSGMNSTTMEDAQLKAAIQAKARRSLLSSTSSPTSLRHLFKSGTSLTRSPSTSSTSSSSSSSTGGAGPSLSGGGSSSRVSVHEALDLQSRSWNRPRIDRYAGSIAASRRTQREYFDYPFTKSSLATISATGQHGSPLWTSGLSNASTLTSGMSTVPSASPLSPPAPGAAANSNNNNNNNNGNETQPSSLPPTPLHFPLSDVNGLAGSEMSPISPVIGAFTLPIQHQQSQSKPHILQQQSQQQQQQQPSHQIHHKSQSSFQEDHGAIHGMRMQNQQQYHPHAVQPSQQPHQTEQPQQQPSSFHPLHQPQLQLNTSVLADSQQQRQHQHQQQQYSFPISDPSQQLKHQHPHPSIHQNGQQHHPPPRPQSRSHSHKRKSLQPNLQRRASSSCLLSTPSNKSQQADDGDGGGSGTLDNVAGQTPPPQRRMSLNLHLQYQQQLPATIEPLDIDFTSTALFNIPMDQIQNAIKEQQENTMSSPPQSQDIASVQMNAHIQQQHQHHHQQQESFSHPQMQQQQQQSRQSVMSPNPIVPPLQSDQQPLPPILLRSNSTPAVSRPRVGPIPLSSSVHHPPFGVLTANDDSVLYTPSHPFGSMAQHALNMYAMTDKITQDLSIPQQYYQMTPQAQLATTLQQLQVQIQMVQLQHPQSNQEAKSTSQHHQLLQPQPSHQMPSQQQEHHHHPHHPHQPQGPSPPPLQVLPQRQTQQPPAQPLLQQPQPQATMVPSQAYFSEPEPMLFDEQNTISEYLKTSNTLGGDADDTAMVAATTVYAEDLTLAQGGRANGSGSSSTQTQMTKEDAEIATLMDFVPFAGHMQAAEMPASSGFSDTNMESTTVNPAAAAAAGLTNSAATLFSLNTSGIQTTPAMRFGGTPAANSMPSNEAFGGVDGGNSMENQPPKPSALKQQRRSIQVLPSHYQQQQSDQAPSLPHFRPDGISANAFSPASHQHHQQEQQFLWSNGNQAPPFIPNGLAHLDLMISQQQQQQQQQQQLQLQQNHPAAMQHFHTQQQQQQQFDIHPHHTFQPQQQHHHHHHHQQQQASFSFPTIMTQFHQDPAAVHNESLQQQHHRHHPHHYEPAPQSAPALAQPLSSSTFSIMHHHHRLQLEHQLEQHMQQLQQQQQHQQSHQ